jgi:hypothetical protein
LGALRDSNAGTSLTDQIQNVSPRLSQAVILAMALHVAGRIWPRT